MIRPIEYKHHKRSNKTLASLSNLSIVFKVLKNLTKSSNDDRLDLSEGVAAILWFMIALILYEEIHGFYNCTFQVGNDQTQSLPVLSRAILICSTVYANRKPCNLSIIIYIKNNDCLSLYFILWNLKNSFFRITFFKTWLSTRNIF